MNKIKKMWKLSRGFSSKNEKLQYFIYKLFYNWLNLDINLFLENCFINQKYFYCDRKNDNNENEFKTYKFKTVLNLNINKENKKKLVSYLKKEKISIKYFEKFEGYIFLVSGEIYKKDVDYLIKGIFIYFINDLYKKKVKLINIKKKEDIDMLIILFKNYFECYIEVLSLNILKNLYNILYINHKYDFRYFLIETEFNLKQIIKYLENYFNLLNNINNLILIKKKKNYIYMETKQNIDLKELDNFFLYNEEKYMYTFLDFCKKKFLNFKGLIFLIEVDVIKIKYKVKRFLICFYNYNNNSFLFLKLFDIMIINFVLIILKLVLINNKDFDADPIFLNNIITNLNNVIFSFESDFSKEDNIILNDNINIININDFNSLIFYLEYYNLYM